MISISVLFIPALITLILVWGLAKRADIYQLFVQGAKEGLGTAVGIMPSIIAIFMAIDILSASGGLDALEKLIAPAFKLVGIPEALFPLILMRPISGSGALVIVEKMVVEYGADSLIGNAASILMGSSETLLYTFAVYFAATSVKKGRHTLVAGIISYIVGVAATMWILNLSF